MKKLLIVFLCLLLVFLCSCGLKDATGQPEQTGAEQGSTSVTESNTLNSSDDVELKETYGEIPAKKLSLAEKIYIFDVNSKLSWRGYKSLDYVLSERSDITADSVEITDKAQCKNFVISLDFENWKETTLPTKSMPNAYIYFENNDLQINMEVLYNGKAYASLNTEEKTAYYEIPVEVYNAIVPTNTSKAVVSKTTDEANKVDFSDKEIINIAPAITSQQLLKVKPKMKYSEIIEAIGVGANYCDFKLNVYRVDGQKVLVLRPESLEDICPYSGKELLEKCVSYPKEAPTLNEKQLFGIIITDKLTFFPFSASEGGYLRNLEKAEIKNADGTTAKATDITVGSKVLIDYNIILSSSPPQIYCTRVERLS